MIGQRIKTLRKEKKLTQSQLADGIITKSMLSMIENGKAETSMRSLREIAKRLDVSVQSLLVDPREAELQALVEDIEYAQLSLNPWDEEATEQALSPYLTTEMNSVWQGKAYVIMGDNLKHGDKRSELLTYYERAINVFERLDEKDELAMALIGKAYYYILWNQFEEASEQFDRLELLDVRNMSSRTRIEYEMLLVMKEMTYEGNLSGAIHHLDSALKHMHQTRTYYRADDVNRTIALCALYLKDEQRINEAFVKARQYIQFTDEHVAKVRLALSEALYAIHYGRVEQLGQQIEEMERLLGDDYPFIAAIEMSQGVYYAMKGEMELGDMAFKRLWEGMDGWKTHSLIDQAVYFEGVLIGASYGCGLELVPSIEESVQRFPEGFYRTHLTELLQKIKG
ncbi:helix-turn-helix domain-containing protein [Exiguobacterium sp. SH3S1]|uniref:helix-turn-helix domain-containing protein n=1 Tax=Exiguobacterium sp. SH3S1 TaxID=2510955 RepID=UPI001038A411|nr:helix-turn-helix transcriptional regulator [Exiguobacterium sp. SH3S1]TCI62211.1 XRE family transcriptional regulator [Exiguobacterium sp. SH3S1]